MEQPHSEAATKHRASLNRPLDGETGETFACTLSGQGWMG
jgi:hypothetical protein